jgi:hypothetical protein
MTMTLLLTTGSQAPEFLPVRNACAAILMSSTM